MMKRIILASQSPYRRDLLNKLNIDFDCMPSDFDESTLKREITDIPELTRQLAYKKAEIIANKHKDAIVIGSDQVCSFEGQILGKTGSIEKSFEQLQKMQGKEHQLITSYVIINNGNVKYKTNTTKLTMRSLSDEQIKFYLTLDNPVDCAGSYKLELNGISLFKKIETEDYTAIIGLPLISLANDLILEGIKVPGGNNI